MATKQYQTCSNKNSQEDHKMCTHTLMPQAFPCVVSVKWRRREICCKPAGWEKSGCLNANHYLSESWQTAVSVWLKRVDAGLTSNLHQPDTKTGMNTQTCAAAIEAVLLRSADISFSRTVLFAVKRNGWRLPRSKKRKKGIMNRCQVDSNTEPLLLRLRFNKQAAHFCNAGWQETLERSANT